MPAHLSAELVERLRNVAKTFRTDDDTLAVVRAALAEVRPDTEGESA